MVEKKPKKETKKPKAEKPAKKEKPKLEKKTNKQKAQNFDPFKVLLYPHLAEKSAALVDTQNKIVFVVNPNSTKEDVKKAVESAFGVKVVDVNIENTTYGEKKAYIRLHSSTPATEVATKLGTL